MLGKRKSIFLNSREFLLQFDTVNGVPYIRESGMLGEIVTTAREAIAGCSDDIVKFVRFDTETNRGEDVTEECAEAYLKKFDGEPTSAIPPFVERSEAWEGWCEDYYRAARTPPRIYSTHNVVQLGLRSPVARH